MILLLSISALVINIKLIFCDHRNVGLSYRGRYMGKCRSDGVYYRDAFSFVTCTHSISYVQPCPPGTRNKAYNTYSRKSSYGTARFCDENLVNYGYTLYNKHPPHGPQSMKHSKRKMLKHHPMLPLRMNRRDDRTDMINPYAHMRSSARMYRVPMHREEHAYYGHQMKMGRFGSHSGYHGRYRDQEKNTVLNHENAPGHHRKDTDASNTEDNEGFEKAKIDSTVPGRTDEQMISSEIEHPMLTYHRDVNHRRHVETRAPSPNFNKPANAELPQLYEKLKNVKRLKIDFGKIRLIPAKPNKPHEENGMAKYERMGASHDRHMVPQPARKMLRQGYPHLRHHRNRHLNHVLLQNRLRERKHSPEQDRRRLRREQRPHKPVYDQYSKLMHQVAHQNRHTPGHSSEINHVDRRRMPRRRTRIHVNQREPGHNFYLYNDVASQTDDNVNESNEQKVEPKKNSHKTKLTVKPSPVNKESDIMRASYPVHLHMKHRLHKKKNSVNKPKRFDWRAASYKNLGQV